MASLIYITTASDITFARRITQLALQEADARLSDPDPNVVAYSQFVLGGKENPKVMAAHVIAADAAVKALIDAAPTQLGDNIDDPTLIIAIQNIWQARADALASGNWT